MAPRHPVPDEPHRVAFIVLYLLDASVLITASNSYYSIDRVPEFWDWLSHVGSQDKVKIPLEIFEEIKDGSDVLSVWIKEDDNKGALLFPEEAEAALVSRVTDEGYAPDLTDDEVEKIGRDPFLIAYALVAPDERCVVTTEVSKPRRRRANRHLPDVCQTMGITCFNSFDFLKALNFSTSWNS